MTNPETFTGVKTMNRKPRILQTTESQNADVGLAAELAKLRAENERLKAAAESHNKIGFKVGNAGGLVITGMGGKYGCVNLFIEQAERLFTDETVAAVRKFMAANAGAFKRKGE